MAEEKMSLREAQKYIAMAVLAPFDRNGHPVDDEASEALRVLDEAVERLELLDRAAQAYEQSGGRAGRLAMLSFEIANLLAMPE